METKSELTLENILDMEVELERINKEYNYKEYMFELIEEFMRKKFKKINKTRNFIIMDFDIFLKYDDAYMSIKFKVNFIIDYDIIYMKEFYDFIKTKKVNSWYDKIRTHIGDI